MNKIYDLVLSFLVVFLFTFALIGEYFGLDCDEDDEELEYYDNYNIGVKNHEKILSVLIFLFLFAPLCI